MQNVLKTEKKCNLGLKLILLLQPESEEKYFKKTLLLAFDVITTK
jgi:hypothetical protein